MSNREECCLLGVLIPSGTSFGVVCSLSNINDFCPALGGARSCGIVSAAPGGGMCYEKGMISLTLGSRKVELTGALGLIITLGGNWP